MSRLLKIIGPLLTLSVAIIGVWTLWQRLSPRSEDLSAMATQPKPFDAAFIRLSPREIATLPIATRFDHPLGSPHAAMTYNARPFRIERHLGDDLNGIGGENSDLGDPVFAAGAGKVVYSGVPGTGWGNMLILAHRVPDGERPGDFSVVQTVYAHLEKITVRPDQSVKRGEAIGTVGTAGGQYFAHLHFEVRQGPYINPSVGYADVPLNRLPPHDFITQHRGAPDDQLNPPPNISDGEAGLEAQIKQPLILDDLPNR